nr:putative nitroreductase family protein [Tanacetum cinerariifolium]
MKSFHHHHHHHHLLLRPSTTLRPPLFTMSISSSPTPQSKQTPNEQSSSSLTQVLTYHNQTKHSFTKYANAPRGLDWNNQPNPFRTYTQTPLLPLLHLDNPSHTLYHSLFQTPTHSQPISKHSISEFFHNFLALSAWKKSGFSSWSLRVNPSSGNLHPTEAYVVFLSDVGLGLFPDECFLLGFSSVFWRESWKYGERAFRYCNHDVGHAIGAVTMAAAGLGWDVKLLDGLGHDELKKIMGLDEGIFDENESEHPDCLLLVFPNGTDKFDVNYKDLSSAISEFSKLDWKGEPNSLSKEHVYWDIIYKTAEAVKKPLTLEKEFFVEPFVKSGSCSENAYKDLSLTEVVRKRRSAVDMDGVTSMERDTFYQILLHCLPSGLQEKQKRQVALPYRAMDWDSEVHCVLFVHRVVGLPKGLYFLVRNEEHLDDLKKATRSDFKWQKPEGCPSELPLYELGRADCEKLSKHLSCHQDIASDGCFSLGMVAHLESTLREKGVWMYPRLFWETGVLGQVLYLEAHAVGLSATGIGCFFDDPVHEVLGLTGLNYQSLYHFTVGGPVVDKRIMSLPAYPGPGVDA